MIVLVDSRPLHIIHIFLFLIMTVWIKGKLCHSDPGAVGIRSFVEAVDIPGLVGGSFPLNFDHRLYLVSLGTVQLQC